MRIDLHTHSNVSDGTQTPAELIASAVAAGLDIVALTDHDTAAGWPEARAAAERLGIGFVSGMEISTDLEGHAIHLLAYLPDPTYPPLLHELDRILVGRSARVPTMVTALNKLGIDITADDVYAQSEDAAASGRPHVADALVKLGVVGDRTEAFDKYLAWGKPAYAERYSGPLPLIIRLVREAGGVPVVAHPWGRSERHWPDEATLAELQAEGLVGIEVDHQDHDAATRAELRAIARNLDLIVTGSSDYHGTGKIDHDLGVNTTAPEQYERLLAAAAEAAVASGREVPTVVAPKAP